MNRHAVPASFSKSQCLSIPKLGLQFLTIHDYLTRNFTLFRNESAHQIRQDIHEAVARLNPRYLVPQDKTIMQGHSRMALSIEKVN
jgi:intron-binding protein aquarius